MFDALTQFIRDVTGNRSRADWRALCRQSIEDSRNWLSENGEIAAIVGFVVGILLVLMFEFVVVVFVIGGLLSYVVWYLSSPSADLKSTVIREAKAQRDQEEADNE